MKLEREMNLICICYYGFGFSWVDDAFVGTCWTPGFETNPENVHIQCRCKLCELNHNLSVS